MDNAERRPPNVLLIVTDQQRHDAVAAGERNFVRTPNLDALCRDGVRFTNAFAAGATCVAARAALFTGMYAHNTGVYSFDKWCHQKTWVDTLHDSGYYCASVGKMHCVPIYGNCGFDERTVVENKTFRFSKRGLPEDAWGRFLKSHGIARPNTRRYDYENWLDMCNAVEWEYAEELHSDRFVGDLAVRWIRDRQPKEPLFMEIGFPGPHEPYDPPSRYLDLYRDIDIPAPIFDDTELDEKPPQQRRFQENFESRHDADSMIRLRGQSADALGRMRKHYYANVTLIDEQVGRILEALKTNSLLDNTVVIFTSDHGDNLGDHGLPYKWFMYDSCVRVPLIVRDFRDQPLRDADHQTIPHLVSHVDIGPTILEYAGVDVPSRLDGFSLLPVLSGEENRQIRQMVVSYDNYLTMVRTHEVKLVDYAGQDYGEVYDLRADPGERKNLWAEARGEEIARELRQQLLRFVQLSCYRNGGHKQGKGDYYSTKLPDDPYYDLDLILAGKSRRVYGSTR